MKSRNGKNPKRRIINNGHMVAHYGNYRVFRDGHRLEEWIIFKMNPSAKSKIPARGRKIFINESATKKEITSKMAGCL